MFGYNPYTSQHSPYPRGYSSYYDPYADQLAYLRAQKRRQQIAQDQERQRQLAAYDDYIRQRNAQIMEQRLRQAREEQAYADLLKMRNAVENAETNQPTPVQITDDTPVEESAENNSAPSSPSPPSPSNTPTPLPTSEQDKPPASIEEQEAAASLIQRQYRIHASFRTLSHLQSQFDSLKADFVLPSTLDFIIDGTTISVPVSESSPDTLPDQSPKPKLAYTSQNKPIHGYIEALSRLLVSLDTVGSWGSKEVRMRRKEIVQVVEGEADAIERRVQDVYRRWLESEKEKEDSGRVRA